MTRALRLTAFSAILLTTIARADPAEPVVTHHQIQVNGKALSYTAEAGRVAIRDVETGEPHGYMFYTAYRLPSGSAPRPVTFIWNGGPGADSALLHFSVSGPRLLQKGQLTDNADTWLTASDLVMVDPIGTGFSRPVNSTYDGEFYSTRGDVASVTEFVRAWLLLHGAEEAPVFLVGESWGAGRAASVAYALLSRGVRVRGMVLISGGWGLNHEYGPAALRNALRVVDMASTALFYGKTAPDLGKDVARVREAADRWARSSYAPALARVGELSDAERTTLAQELSRFTGIPADQIDHQKLVISQRQFRELLLKSDGKQPYIFDLRVSTPESRPGGAPAILHYLRHDLGYRTELPYVGLEALTQGFAPSGTYPEPVNERWNYATKEPTAEELKAAMEAASREGSGPPHIGPPLPATEEAIAVYPDLRILVAAGMYDGFQPCAAGAETETQLPPELRRAIQFKCYTGGHAMYLDAATRRELSRDVKALIASTERRE